MFKEGDMVLVIDQDPPAEGVVEKVSTWDKVVVYKIAPLPKTPCYFVRVQSWDNGRNGGRWLDEGSLAAPEAGR